MYLQLSENTIVRQYGPYTYVQERLSDYDQVYTDAEVFLSAIERYPRSIEDIVEQICGCYCNTSREVVRTDFIEFITPLINAGIVLAGETIYEIQHAQKRFSYDVDRPKTMNRKALIPLERQDLLTPQHLLEDYFQSVPTIFSIQIDVTQSCTERCIHCYIPEYDSVFLPFEVIARTIDEFRLQGGVEISFSGGECMMHPDFIRIIEYAHAADLSIGVLTNLTLCTDEMIQVLRKVGASVQVSLYSMNPTTHDLITRRPGSWNKTKNVIEKLHTENVPCSISCPTMKQNHRDYLGVLEYARSLKMDARTDFVMMGKMNCDTSNLSCRLNLKETRQILEDIIFRSIPVNSEYFDPRKKEDFRTDEEWSNDRVCGACISSICLSATGNYYPCPAFGGVNLGSCYEHDLKWIWNESPETLRIRAVRGQDFKKCIHCKDRDYCSVCMCRNFNETGDIFTPAQHFCDVAKLNHEVVEERFESLRGLK